MEKDILNKSDITLLVDSFYNKVRKDTLLAAIFNDRIHNRWPAHLEKMYSFWQTVLLGEHTYHGSPFAPHVKLQVEPEHFYRWLDLFYEAVDENFRGKKAEEAKWRAEKMAQMFNHKITYYRNNPDKMIL